MNFPICVRCSRPVLELRGQHMLLDSYLITDGSPPDGDVGPWHVSCLEASSAGTSWFPALARNYTTVRGYRALVDTGGWQVMENPRTGEVLALDRRGPVLSLLFNAAPVRLVAGGAAYRVVELEYGLQLGNAAWTQEIQAALKTRGEYSILELARGLAIEPQLSHAALLTEAAFHFDEALEPEWDPLFVLAPVEYQVFVPSELFAYVRIRS
jgi:hypothetical protein